MKRSRIWVAVALSACLGLGELATPAQAAFRLDITSVTSPVRRGSKATAKVKTVAGARCGIKVTYKSGPSKARGLDPKTASSAGAVAWTWTVGTNTTPGKWPVDVSCAKGSGRGAKRRTFEVRR